MSSMIAATALAGISVAFVWLFAIYYLERCFKGVHMEKRCRSCFSEVIEGAPRNPKDIGAQVRGFCSKLCWDVWEYENERMRKAVEQ